MTLYAYFIMTVLRKIKTAVKYSYK